MGFNARTIAIAKRGAPVDSPDVANERQVSIRLPSDVVDRAEALVPALSRLPAHAAFRVERATVLKLALMRGLELLEREHGPGGAPVAEARKRGRKVASP